MEIITEDLQTKVLGEFGVIVAGGGIAGISAALAAARQGADVLLIESSYILGGLATSGLVTIYLPLCDGMGRQVSFGICDELIRLSVKNGFEDKYPDAWLNGGDRQEKIKKRFEVQFNPHFFAIETEKLLKNNGVQILYGTKICGIKKKGKRAEYVITENKSGRCAYRCKSAVDCTGDADLFYYCDVPTSKFKAQNVLAGWYYYFSKGKVNLKMLGYSENPENQGGETLIPERFEGLDGMENSRMVQFAHDHMLKDILKRRENDETYVPVTMPTIPQLRMTRKIKGAFTLDESDEHKYFETSIGMISNWKKCGPVYEIPFETLFSNECENLFAAGRCISVTDLMWDISRVIPACAVTGEAAGTAAAMLCKYNAVHMKDVQKRLIENGAVLHENDLKDN